MASNDRARDVLIHHYFGVDYDLVWDVVVNKAPILAKHVKEILASQGDSDRRYDLQQSRDDIDLQ